MEDLKKQTAIRLAQEQQRSRFFGGFPQRKDRNLHGVPEQQQIHVSASPTFFHGQQQPMQNIVNYNNPNQIDTYHYEDPAIAAAAQQQAAASANQQRAYARSASTVSAGSNNSYTSSSSQLNDSTRSASQQSKPTQQQMKSKLPHGLTVQELKEMTKARLQAEAQEADKSTLAQNHQQAQYHPQEHHVYPISTVPVEQMASFAGYQDHPAMTRGFGNTGATTPVTVPPTNGPPGFPSVPSTNSLNSNNLDLQTQGWQQQQQPMPTQQQQQQKMDAWETGSVASINSSNIGSEYLGSESASAYTDEFNEIPFSRNRSFPVGGYEGGFYDMNLTPNRRRACTLSPRVGLLHLHEDRPMFEGGVTELKIPSFDSSVRNNLGFRMGGEEGPNRNRTYSGGTVPAFNRPRTASAPTVPFHNDDLFDNSGLESNDVLPNSVVESVLGGSSSPIGGDNYSSVFRSTKDDFATNLLQGTPAPTPVKASFNWGGFDGDDGGASLANDLGSMLNLSGINDTAPHESSLASRMDQETSLFPSLSGNGGRASNSALFGQDQSYFDPRDDGRHGSTSH